MLFCDCLDALYLPFLINSSTRDHTTPRKAWSLTYTLMHSFGSVKSCFRMSEIIVESLHPKRSEVRFRQFRGFFTQRLEYVLYQVAYNYIIRQIR